MSEITSARNGVDDATAVAERMLQLLPADGSAISSPKLLLALGVTEATLQDAKEILSRRGLIRRTRGRGGGVTKIVQDSGTPTNDPHARPNLGAHPDAAAVCDLLPADGTPIGNYRIMKILHWDDQRYWTARNYLISEGIAVRGQGRGGSLKLALQPEAEAKESDDVSTLIADQNQWPAKRPRESDLYLPIAEVIGGAWATDHGLTPVGVEITAQQGGRATGGRWTRPDLAMVTVQKFQFVPGAFLDVTTFEVKTADAIDVLAVFEALSHRSAATYSYVIFNVPKKLKEDTRESLNAVRDAAVQHGIGLITTEDPADYETWDDLVVPQRYVPDPAAVNDFIGKQLSNGLAHKIMMQVR